MSTVTAEQLDQLLPQTQCGDCTFSGCLPYARALAAGEADIDLCLPGGTHVLKKIASRLGKDPTPLLARVEQKTKPAQIARIDEDQCIGCTKCIQACPVDAILGASKQMHTIITSECSGCELCIEPCPMDCITLNNIEESSSTIKQAQSDLYRERYTNRELRLQREQLQKNHQHKRAQFANYDPDTSLAAKKDAIAAALSRTQTKRHPKNV